MHLELDDQLYQLKKAEQDCRRDSVPDIHSGSPCRALVVGPAASPANSGLVLRGSGHRGSG